MFTASSLPPCRQLCVINFTTLLPCCPPLVLPLQDIRLALQARWLADWLTGSSWPAALALALSLTAESRVPHSQCSLTGSSWPATVALALSLAAESRVSVFSRWLAHHGQPLWLWLWQQSLECLCSLTGSSWPATVALALSLAAESRVSVFSRWLIMASHCGSGSVSGSRV